MGAKVGARDPFTFGGRGDLEALGVGVVVYVGVAVAVAVSVASSNSTLCDTDGEAAISQYGGSTYDHTPVS